MDVEEHRIYHRKYQRKAKEKLILYMGGKCVNCGLTFAECPYPSVFHIDSKIPLKESGKIRGH